MLNNADSSETSPMHIQLGLRRKENPSPAKDWSDASPVAPPLPSLHSYQVPHHPLENRLLRNRPASFRTRNYGIGNENPSGRLRFAGSS